MNATLAAFAHSCGGRLVGPDAPFSGVSTDSRTLVPGQLVDVIVQMNNIPNAIVLPREAPRSRKVALRA